MSIKHLGTATSVLAVLTVISCITVNIYFPEAAVQKTAEEIVNEVRDREPKDQKLEKKSFSWIPAAFAQQETTVSTPGIRAIKESLKTRFPELVPLFDGGRIGESSEGLIEIRDEAGLGLADKASLRKLAKEENADRRSLYAEVAKAMSIDAGQIPKIQKIFAERWINDARPGWWIQGADGVWIRKIAG